MAIQKTDTGRVVLSNAEYVHVTPYVNEDTLGTTTYDIVDIVGDSLSFTPDDNTINAKESEFKDDPLFENVTLGKYQFAATCIDFQNIVMQHIYGWEVDGDNVYAPTGYKDKYALIEVGFRNEDVVVVAPKVKLNSKATIGSLKTGTGEGAMAGTAYTGVINSKKSPIAFLKAEKDEEGVATATYTLTIGDKSSTFTAGAGVGGGE
jgi:hypothetical protein